MATVVNRRFERRVRIEWRTLAVIVCFWLAISATVGFSSHLPTVVKLGALSLLGAFFGSLQHEVIHRHPTPWLAVNRMFVIVPLQLFMPFERYRITHLQHHDCDLTDPFTDPESYYLSRSEWQRSGRLLQMIFRGNRMLVGRLSYGPGLTMIRYWAADLRLCLRDRTLAGVWLRHLVSCCVVVWLIVASPLQLWVYLVGFVYGGLALTLLRSFAEHCADHGIERTAVVATGWFFSLLFLNNNLHIAHHDQPHLAWFQLPEVGRRHSVIERARQGGGYYTGYLDVTRQYGLRQFCQVVHPYQDASVESPI
jgi:fatty acid desaturase